MFPWEKTSFIHNKKLILPIGNWPLGRSSSDHEYDWTVKFSIIRSNICLTSVTRAKPNEKMAFPA